MSSPVMGAHGLAAVLLIFAPSSSGAQTWGQVGERAQGMGGAFVAVADDASAIYWNPAGLATGSIFDAQLDLTMPKGTTDNPEPRRLAFIGAAMPPLGLAYYRVRSAVTSSANRENGGGGEVRVSALDTQNFGVSLVQSVASGLVVGSTLRVVNGGDSTAFDLDAGAMASIGSVRVGLATRNLRRAIDTERYVRVGAALVPRSRATGLLGPFSLAIDVDVTRTATVDGDQRQLSIGSEQWWVHGAFGTRLGTHWSTVGAAQPAVAGGLTVRLPHSVFAEGHMTKGRENHGSDWGFGGRVTF